MTDVLWQPPDTTSPTTTANIAAFVEALRADGTADLEPTATALHRWSIDHPELFWSEVWGQSAVVGSQGDRVMVHGDELWQTRFFPDARLNFAQNLLRRRDDTPAIVFRDEVGTTIDLTWSELYDRVSQLVGALRAAGIEPGDRVAAWMPNRPETYAIMLAAASIGAVFSSTSPDFGVSSVVDRFAQIEPKLLFAADGYHYGGKTHDCLERLTTIVEQLPSLERVIVLEAVSVAPLLDAIPAAVSFSDFLVPHPPTDIDFTLLPFDHPLYILYSSGTTGAPKCIVHRAGGILFKHLTEHQLHTNVVPGDRVFYFTTAGWMMWNWLASGLAAEATLVLYDGSPFHRDGTVLFDLIDEVDINVFGTSAKFIDAVAKAGLRPIDTHDLSSLRTILSTGSPLAPEGFRFVYDAIAPAVHLASISGGTDLCGCLVAGDPTAPVHAGEIQMAGFGLDTDVVDESGRSVSPGERGELVCRNAFPSMPLGFWDDDEDRAFCAVYFDRYPGLWHQGDYAERSASGGFIIHGRSDATLNPGGVRIGTAEIYRQVEQLDDVIESLVIGQDIDGDTRIVLFVVLRPGGKLDDDLQARIRTQIRSGATPRHVPAVIAAVPVLARTRSGKLVELAVREVVHGRPVKNREALANPEALDFVRDHPALQT